jgi:hypothetical protein
MQTRMLAAAALLITSSALQVGAATPSAPFVVHEWGTFTSVQGQDGKQVTWQPFVQTDLPRFVYDLQRASTQEIFYFGGKESMAATVRMETPVIYFYSDKERVVDVHVSFPEGRVTEWYPQASRLGPYMKVNSTTQTPEQRRSLIEWQGVTILAPDSGEMSANRLIREDGPASHYYSARNTDANFVKVSSRARGTEYERDLFYRGVGFFPGPLTATMDSSDTAVTLTTLFPETLSDAFVLTVRKGQMRYQHVDRVTADASMTVALDAVPFETLSTARERLMADVAQALVGQGLYEKEARAMVDTWKDQWFADEGTRVLYLLPRSWTDRVLPLHVKPAPDRMVRVMVGRAELITPSLERALRQQITAYQTGDQKAREQVIAATRTLAPARFLLPATTIALRGNPDRALNEAAFGLSYVASLAESAPRAATTASTH